MEMPILTRQQGEAGMGGQKGWAGDRRAGGRTHEHVVTCSVAQLTRPHAHARLGPIVGRVCRAHGQVCRERHVGEHLWPSVAAPPVEERWRLWQWQWEWQWWYC